MFVAPIGLRVDVGDHPRVVELARRSFAEVPAGATDLELRVEVAPTRHAGREVANWIVEGDRLEGHFGRSSVVGSARAGFDIQIDPIDLEEREELVRRIFLVTPILFVVGLQRAIAIHAAGLVASTGAALVRAASGGGKSTMAAAWASTGGAVLSDDTVWLERGVDAAELHGFGPIADLLPDARTRFGSLKTTPMTTPGGELKHSVVGDAAPSPVALKALVVLDRRQSGAGIEEIAADEFLRQVVATGLPQEDVVARDLRLTSLAARLPCWRLVTGGDPIGAASRLRACLDGR